MPEKLLANNLKIPRRYKSSEPNNSAKYCIIIRMENNKDQRLKIAVRQLLSFTRNSGGLAQFSFRALGAAEGTRLHRKLYRELEAESGAVEYLCEYSLQAEFHEGGLSLLVSGRADVLVQYPDHTEIMEVKSSAKPLSEIRSPLPQEQVDQCRMYAYMQALAEAEKQERVPAADAVYRYVMVYLPSETYGGSVDDSVDADTAATAAADKLLLPFEESFASLQAFFQDTCRKYLNFATNVLDYRRQSRATMAAMRFPYPDLRFGQKEFMQKLLRSLQRRTPMLVKAPTGTGKTVSVLYPSLKALYAGFSERIFYLTAKTSTRLIAEDCVKLMQTQGLVARCLTLTAKEKICPVPEYYCDTKLCPYAHNYYKNLAKGLERLLPMNFIGEQELLAVANEFKLCPFELSLDLALYCDIIIADYNHAFDPRAKLDRFFNQPDQHYILLVDEAHNLPDRLQEMYSAELSGEQLSKAYALCTQIFPSSANIFGSSLSYFQQLCDFISAKKSAFDSLEKGVAPEDLMLTDGFRAMRRKPDVLLSRLRGLVHNLRKLLDELPASDYDELRNKRAILDFYFAAQFFLKIADEYFDSNYVLMAEGKPGGNLQDLKLKLYCLDASRELIKLYHNKHSIVFFSATLSPLEYYRMCFCGDNPDNRPDELALSSPFPKENLSVIVYDKLKTTYADRKRELEHLAKTIAVALKYRPGRYLLFFPSYDYMNMALPQIKNYAARLNTEVFAQKRNMKEADKKQFLENFTSHQGESLLGVALLGGIFGEGIDLIGESLTGVIIVGTGLPQFGPQREIMKGYFDERYQNGYAYAYRFPGFNKVLQAAGRLIRSEHDRGVILLLDERYEREDYRWLLADEWSCEYVSSLQELAEILPGAANYDEGSELGLNSPPK